MRIKGTIDVILSDMSDSQWMDVLFEVRRREGWKGQVQGLEKRRMNRTGSK